MKIGVILCLAAGPLLARAQKPGRLFPGGLPDSIAVGWRPPAVKIAGTAARKPWSVYSDKLYRPFPENLHWSGDEKKPNSIWAANSVRILMPDHMACLVSQYPDPIPVDRRKGRDPMPNGVKRVKN